MNTEQLLTPLADDISVWNKCDLFHSREKGVPGEGPPDAEIMFIGEGPGFHENMQGRPFVGAAGELLVELLGKIGLKREDVFITNVVKCRPPGNRDPQPEELAACYPYLERQIKLINPSVIVTLGRFSMARFIPNAKISQIHGQAIQTKGMLVVPFSIRLRLCTGPHCGQWSKRILRHCQIDQKCEKAPPIQVEEPQEENNQAEQLSLF